MRLTINRRWLEVYPVRLRDILRFVGSWVVIQPNTDYVQRCRADDVPIPPQWSEANPNGWAYYSKLVQNLLPLGDHAFLMSPDDPTWAKILQPVKQTSVGANFTTNLDSGIPRYTMMSSQAGRTDPSASPCVGCHE